MTIKYKDDIDPTKYVYYKPCSLNENYLIYTDGKVYSKLSKMFVKKTLSSGYPSVNLQHKKTVRIHRLIAMEFIINDDPQNKKVVDHLDHDRTNCDVTNLEWVTSSENTKRSMLFNKNSNDRPIVQYDMDGNFVAEFKSAQEGAEKTGSSHHMISKFCSGKASHVKDKDGKRFTWKYKTFVQKEKIPEGKQIKGYERYIATKDGRVYSVYTKKFLTLQKNKDGYMMVCLYNKGSLRCLVNRVIATTFLGDPPSPKHQVNHKNCIRDDDRVENLCWVTSSENNIHSSLNGSNKAKKVKIIDLDDDTEMFFDSPRQASEKLNLKIGNVRYACQKETVTSSRYKCAYVKETK